MLWSICSQQPGKTICLEMKTPVWSSFQCCYVGPIGQRRPWSEWVESSLQSCFVMIPKAMRKSNHDRYERLWSKSHRGIIWGKYSRFLTSNLLLRVNVIFHCYRWNLFLKCSTSLGISVYISESFKSCSTSVRQTPRQYSSWRWVNWILERQ